MACAYVWFTPLGDGRRYAQDGVLKQKLFVGGLLAERAHQSRPQERRQAGRLSGSGGAQAARRAAASQGVPSPTVHMPAAGSACGSCSSATASCCTPPAPSQVGLPCWAQCSARCDARHIPLLSTLKNAHHLPLLSTLQGSSRRPARCNARHAANSPACTHKRAVLAVYLHAQHAPLCFCAFFRPRPPPNRHYQHHHHHHRHQPTTHPAAAQLDATCEQFLALRFGLHIDFAAEQALPVLARWGLVSQGIGGVLQVGAVLWVSKGWLRDDRLRCQPP